MRTLTLLLASISACASATTSTAAPQGAGAANTMYYELLSRETVDAARFTTQHPTWDGRGVVVAVLDTGVDPLVPGLQRTSTGSVKVIEARDFSGQGDVPLSKARVEQDGDVAILRSDEGIVRGHSRLEHTPADGIWYLGFFDEAKLVNAGVQDLNRNGHTKDRFAVVAFKSAAGEALCAIDTDGDGDVSDESLRPSYRIKPEAFTFTHPDPAKNQSPVGFTITLLLEEEKAEIHFDDGAHGTHCAGISAGFQIHDRPGFDGIAPGAQVMSLKIGDNSLSGGATTPQSMKRAIEYASRWARDKQIPVVINLSYGVGSELEGESDIDKVLTEALEANRLLVASVAAGNDGPGLSTVGTPGASARAWTAGALLNRANAEALWGGRIDKARVFSFSSRGGELAKPDGLSPGVAWSTVPPFYERSVMAGTSMATPQAAGVHALLISAALQTKTPWTSGTLKRALRTSAKAIRGYTVLDQGAGLIQVGSAWKSLRDLSKHPSSELTLDWNVTTPIPHRPGHEGSASFWRTGSYVPAHPHRIEVKVEPVFIEASSDRAKHAYFDRFALKSSVSWIDLDRSQLTLRGEHAGSFKITLDADALMGQPGLHVGSVSARLVGTSSQAFTVPVTVIIPERFSHAKTRQRRFEGSLSPGSIDRLFIAVPPGANSMNLHFAVPTGRFGSVWLNIFDPEGRQVAYDRYRASSKSGAVAIETLSGSRLKPGIWEIAPYATFRNHKKSYWALDVAFTGLQLSDELVYTIPEGGHPKATTTVLNHFDQAFIGRAAAQVIGMQRERDIEIDGTDKEFTFHVAKGSTRMTLEFEVSARDHARFTDLAIDILDAQGKAIQREVLGYRFLHTDFPVSPGTYTVRVSGAASGDTADLQWALRVVERHHRSNAIELEVKSPHGTEIVLYPNVRTELSFSAKQAFVELPDDFVHAATLRMTEGSTGRLWLSMPLTLVR